MVMDSSQNKLIKTRRSHLQCVTARKLQLPGVREGSLLGKSLN